MLTTSNQEVERSKKKSILQMYEVICRADVIGSLPYPPVMARVEMNSNGTALLYDKDDYILFVLSGSYMIRRVESA